MNGAALILAVLVLAVAASRAGDAEQAVPFAAKWADDGKWANSPAAVASGPGGGAEIGCGGFAQVASPFPAMEAGAVYRIRLAGRTEGQIEKVTLLLRETAKPYAALASDDLPLDGGRLSADVQVKAPAAAPAGTYGLFLLVTGVGTIGLEPVQLSRGADFLLPAAGRAGRGELLLNPAFALREGGWKLDGGARIDGAALVLDAGARIIQAEPVVLRVGRRYRVALEGTGEAPSLFLRGGENREIRRFSPRLAEGRWSETFALSPPESGMLPASRPAFLVLEGAGPSRITRIDLDEVSDGSGVPAARPAAWARFERGGVRVSRIAEGEKVDLLARVAGIPQGETVVVRVRDAGGETAAQAEGKVDVLGDGTRGFAVRGVALPPGWFDTEMIRADGTPLAVVPGEVAVLKPAGPPCPDWILGAHLQTWATVRDDPDGRKWKAAPDAAATLAAARRLGISSQRMHPPLGTKWWAVEPEKGKWLFPDDLVDAARDAGVSVLGLLDGTPRHASSAPPAQLAAAEGWPRNWAVFPARDEADWRNYVRVMAARYQDRVRAWEVWNEPDNRGFLGINPEAAGGPGREEVYAGLVKAAAEEVRKVDPAITIVAGAVTAVGREFLLKAIDDGLLDACDAISFHGYDQVRGANRGTLAFSGMVGPLREAMRRHGREVPIWDTESSLGALPEGRSGLPAAQAEIKGILARRAVGIARLYLYDGFRKAYPLHDDYRMLWGFDDRPLALQPMLAANSALLGGTAFAANLGDEEKGEHVFLFQGAGRRVIAAWSSGGDVEFPAPGGFSEGAVVDVMGTQCGAFHRGCLPLSPSVRYFVPGP